MIKTAVASDLTRKPTVIQRISILLWIQGRFFLFHVSRETPLSSSAPAELGVFLQTVYRYG
jgi:hypothetical protein